ncbi:class I SAM-dependent methyltransferase [Halomonas maura]|uniref:class I SAM-dependent methyltransferase n=1 Tax=Halomonas maura TaxID=117606 RepID=UPI0025B3FAFF|nr:class I SAM-dependent methyltransferase [Halomonas maura]MDN3556961.1 class I SAM-dependent methyltransferase [Halomonas maura]
MTSQTHWDAIYRNKAPDRLSWYQPHLTTSLWLIEAAAPSRETAIIDIGGGQATLVDDLLARGYRDLTVLDLSPEALKVAKCRLGDAAERVTWRVADITRGALPAGRYGLWHDRAVFHFLVTPEQRTAYVRQLRHSLVPGGHLVIATFGPEGPTRCSGLDVVRYDADTLAARFDPDFERMSHQFETHHTPDGKPQSFLFAHFRRRVDS